MFTYLRILTRNGWHLSCKRYENVCLRRHARASQPLWHAWSCFRLCWPVNNCMIMTMILDAGSTNNRSRAVQFQDHVPFSSTSELMVSRKKAKSSTPPKTKKSSRARSKTPPKASTSAISVQKPEQSAIARLAKGKDGGKAKVDKILGRLQARTAVALPARTMSLSSSTSAQSPRATAASSTSSSRLR